MRSPRFHRIVRIGVMVLLAWTALDLTAPSLCALDAEGQSTDAAYSVNDTEPSIPADVPAEPGHVDDCFCCSHCVEPTALPAPAGLEFVVTQYRALPDSLPLSAALPLYHPPRS